MGDRNLAAPFNTPLMEAKEVSGRPHFHPTFRRSLLIIVTAITKEQSGI